MRHLILCFLLFPFLANSQNSTVFQVWNEAGISYKLDKKQSFAFDFTTRHNASGLKTYFPQISYKYKFNKLIRPSIDYRFIGDKNQEGNVTFRHRLNANLQFNHEFGRLQLGLRLRYQYSTNRLAENFEPEFGQALRIKPSLAYDLPKTDLEPQVSMEFFTGPMDGQNGYHLNRIRWCVGLAYTFEGPHSKLRICTTSASWALVLWTALFWIFLMGTVWGITKAKNQSSNNATAAFYNWSE